MRDDPKRPWTVALELVVAAAAAIGLGFAVSMLQRAPDGPVPILWDEEVCAHCRMHIGEPAFAAQLHTTAGEVLSFDDPGCLFELERGGSLDVNAVYFHHVREDRWLSEREVAFERVDRSPMGFGLGAVDAGTPGALTLDEARSQLAGPPAALLEH